MKIKILASLCLIVLSITVSCQPPQCRFCNPQWTPGLEAVVAFPPSSGRRQLQRIVGPDSCVTYPPGANGECNGIVTLLIGGFRFFAFPSSVDLQAPPTTFTVSGSDISTTYGMPKVQYWDDYGQLLGEVTATAVAPDGSWLQATTPNLSQAYSGNWSVYVLNRTWDGGIEHVGSALVNTYGRDYVPPPDNPCDNPNMLCTY